MGLRQVVRTRLSESRIVATRPIVELILFGRRKAFEWRRPVGFFFRKIRRESRARVFRNTDTGRQNEESRTITTTGFDRRAVSSFNRFHGKRTFDKTRIRLATACEAFTF